MREEEQGRPKCDKCDNYATINYQECMVSWRIDDNGDYEGIPCEIEETSGDSLHRCDDHLEL